MAMAVNLNLCPKWAVSSSSSPSQLPTKINLADACTARFRVSLGSNKIPNGGGLRLRLSRGGALTVRSSLDTAGPTATVGQVTEVNKDTFWPIVKSAGDKTVVVDMYTQWCGPCKVMAPKFQELSKKYLDVIFLKLDCNQENKPLAKELGIRVVPTFKILKDSKVVKEVTGAKFDDLVFAIETVRSN